MSDEIDTRERMLDAALGPACRGPDETPVHLAPLPGTGRGAPGPGTAAWRVSRGLVLVRRLANDVVPQRRGSDRRGYRKGYDSSKGRAIYVPGYWVDVTLYQQELARCGIDQQK